MKRSIRSIFNSPAPVFPPDPDQPIRSELFSGERLERHAETLAAAQRVTDVRTTDRRLTRRLEDNGHVLLEAYRGIERTVRDGRVITPADEWLLDNFYLAQEQIRQIRRDLPRGFYRGLPKLAEGHLAGDPRVFGLAWAFVAHTDSRFDRELLLRFVAAYQRVQPLTIGELWAVAISLRMVLVENLRRSAEQIACGRIGRHKADVLADRLLGVGGRPPSPPAIALRGFEGIHLPSSFVVRLLQRLRDQDPRVTPALVWLDERLATEGTTAEAIVRQEHQFQVGMNVTVRNIITSMRVISALDWTRIVESMSLVDAALRAGSAFDEMDFPTRDRYRHAIEELARGSGKTELEVTRQAIALAVQASGTAGADDAARRESEPGYYLISRGRRRLEKMIGFRVPVGQWIARGGAAAGILGYITGIAVVAALILAVPLVAVSSWHVGGWALVLLALLAVPPTSDLAVAMINRAVTNDLNPRTLPALELRAGVPASFRTMVVVPTLLTDVAAVDEQIERLEVHYLASQDGELRFALLSDWADSPTETADGDSELLEAARDGIARLNERYGAAPDGPRFFLLHRRRLWNEGESKWIGWERKRGKLHELNMWLRGATETTFLPLGGVPPVPPAGVRYVITLDADTRLPPGAARRLVGKMAHPLNRPQLDPRSGRVLEGYAVLQPRVTPSLPSPRGGSIFDWVFTSPTGLDPYAFAVSDVYQDLFGEGSYTGKGIYDVDVFEAALAGRIPESTLLSHDLLEGIFARAGLVTDVEVVEEFPSRYDVAAARQHRWARGDWQLLPWIFGHGPESGGDRQRRAIPLLSRWKMLDNLRRTVSAPATFLALFAGWMLPPAAALIWSGFVLGTVAIPAFLPVASGILPHSLRASQRRHWRAVGTDLLMAALQVLLVVTLIAHQAWLMSDAIIRTLTRLYVRRQRLLEWVTAAQSEARARLDLGGWYRWMAGGVALAACAAVVVALAAPPSLLIAAPFLCLWLASPAITRWASRRQSPPGWAVSRGDALALRLVARRTWRFFETFVTEAHHHLPPDNFQEAPEPVVAHRTSPTNMGLYLLSVLAARDFGWLGTRDALDRLDATLTTMERLERCRGHFYNWYDTHDLRPLDPKYVSSVDSGNLAGHLIAISRSCRQMRTTPAPVPSWLDGIDDGVALVRESILLLTGERRTHTVGRKHMEEAVEALSAGVAARRLQPAGADLQELLQYAETAADIARTLHAELNDQGSAELQAAADGVYASIASHQRDLDAAGTGNVPLETQLTSLVDRMQALFEAMDFELLFDTDRQLLSIGYRVADGTLDPSCYDLLASEARLASFVAIAKGDLPARHWFRLGRAVTPVGSRAALISWSGSMFEYLMPTLVMQAPAWSFLDDTNRVVVHRQERYGADRGLPWGISESAYNARDLELTYQYSSFGVPGLGLKRGLADDAVVAPYATALAAPYAPRAAVRNFERLAAAGGRGRYGWYEALDYTPSRVPEGEKVAIVRAYMAHHQGMTVVALANTLHRGLIPGRFHAEPIIQATELLLQERGPRDVEIVQSRREWVRAAAYVRELVPPVPRRFLAAHQPIPHTQLLSNGRYAVMMTAAGSGYSRWQGLAVTRWREDATTDSWGSYIFVRDVETGAVWSAGYQPTGAEPDRYEATFFEDRVEIVRSDGSMSTRLEVAVSPEDDAEVRRVTITNGGSRVRDIELTSYAEIVLAPDAADAAHPAFSKLFVQTDTGRQPRGRQRGGATKPRTSARTFIDDSGAILATRRHRSPDEPEVWAAHLAVVEGELSGAVEFETDRARFLGRGRGIRTPVSVIDGHPLSNTTGAVLDPIFSLRRRVRLAPGETAHVTFWTMVASSRSEVLGLADKHHDPAAFERAATLAWTQAQVELFHLGIDADEASLFQRLATHVLYANSALRPSSDVLARSEGVPPDLWAYGISGDLPIVVCRIDDISDLQIARQLLRAHEYWRMKQLPVDLVIINEHPPSYAQDLQEALEGAMRASQSRLPPGAASARGAVFILRGEHLPASARALLQSVARAVLFSRRGTLSEQVKRLEELQPAAVRPSRRAARPPVAAIAAPRRELEFFNGLGGFAGDGREYVTSLGEGQWTPAPWINVVANPAFGFQASVEGGGYAWAINSQQNQLTPWSNDPVSDRPGEVLYIRDEEDGTLWTPAALPIREEAEPYVVSHGQGYSRFEHTSHGIALELLQYVPVKDPVKISRLRIRNESDHPRRLSVTAYVEWALGVSRAAAAPFVVTEIDPGTGAMLARNHWRTGFGTRVAFADLSGRQTSWTGDRKEFLGRNGTLDHPGALEAGTPLTNRTGGGLDPCAALQTSIDLAAQAEVEIALFLGEAPTREEARALVVKYRSADLDAVFREVTAAWDAILDTVHVMTPDRAMDILLNRWLLYQTLGCRVWARTGFYQASGAYGFRDQLQDVMALSISAPHVTREHILRAAARQFVQGDVQHWWLPPEGQGVRTRISDDRLWLPYATAQYIEVTGETGILDEIVPFLDGPELTPEQHESFFQPSVSREKATLFEHCARAIEASLGVGPHGLPLMGTGDWNDGMNRIGAGGTGESVWLAWFLHATVSAFAPLADARGEHQRASSWRQHAQAIAEALEREAWDGAWYARAYFDDGTPVGVKENEECRIDSIAQSWGVLSGVAEKSRASTAMASVDEHLVRREEGLLLLFTPPFDRTPRDPGYIKGYPPGIRENGGQYTHAAVWSVIAFAMLGDGDKAGEVFSLLNPIRHAGKRADIYRYKVEPYVMSADVYAEPSQVGRGGWTWYTGSAGWMYRAGLEWILGFALRGTTLVIDPCIPKGWPGFSISFRYRSARYEIAVENPQGVSRGVSHVALDGAALPAGEPIPLADDKRVHNVKVVLG